MECHKGVFRGSHGSVEVPQTPNSTKELVVFGGIASDDASALLSDDGARRRRGPPLIMGIITVCHGVPLQCHPPSTPTNSHPCVILIAA